MDEKSIAFVDTMIPLEKIIGPLLEDLLKYHLSPSDWTEEEFTIVVDGGDQGINDVEDIFKRKSEVGKFKEVCTPSASIRKRKVEEASLEKEWFK